MTMNRIIQSAIALSVLFYAVSCNEKITTDLPDTGDEITVTLQVDPQTKAGYEGTSVLPGSFYMEINNPSFKDIMTRASSTSNKYNFPNGTNLKWGVADVGQVTIKAITTPDGCYSNGTMSIQEDQSTADKLRVNDLLGASTGNGIVINNNNINISFNHLMSKLQLAYTSSIAVKKIELVNICRTGQYNFNQMSYGSATAPSANTKITMYHDSSNKTAEAIFFPYTPSSEPKVRIYFNDTQYNECTISLKSGSGFEGGKVYMVNINISGDSISSSKVTIEGWGNMQVPGERVLWIGTSIPSGDPSLGYTSYPEAVDMAMNCTVVNNAVGSSQVTKQLNADWVSDKSKWDYKLAGGLSQTYDEIEEMYKAKLQSVSNGDQTWVTNALNDAKSLSYESLIIPYINGTKDNCTTIIIDHGFNDLSSMMNIGNCLVVEGDPVRGYSRIMDLIYGDSSVEDKLTALEQSIRTVSGNPSFINLSYILCMKHIIDEIRLVNPNIRIIIGNYFTFNNPKLAYDYYVYNEYFNSQGLLNLYWDYATITNLICYFNEAVAAICDVDIVNVYKYFWISDDRFWAGYGADGNPIHDDSKFCIDGTHPWNPDAVKAIAEVYISELDGVIGSRN